MSQPIIRGTINTTSSGGGGGGASTIADGADVAEGTTTDSAVTSSATGTVSGKLRGLIALQNPLDYDTGAGTVSQGLTGIALPASGGPVGVSATNPLPVTGTITAVTAITNALPAGTNVIGHVIADSGSTTAVTGNVASTIADGADVTLGAKADAKSTATDTTAVSAMSVLKQISASVQAPPSQAVTNAGTFAVQATISAGSAVIGHVIADSGSTTVVTGNVAGTVADGANVTLGAKADAKSTATDTTSVSAMSVLKQISASVQAPPSQAVTNAGTFATQSAITAASGSIASGAVASGAYASGSIADGANVTFGAKADAKNTATDTTSVSAMSVLKQISASVQAPPSQAVTNAGTFAVQAAVTAASGAFASGSIASGALASGSVASGAIASGAFASGSISAGAVAAGATSFVKLEDAASADADAGVPAMAIQKATPADTAGTDGDYVMLQMSAGRLWAAANIDKINAVTPLMGAGNTGTGSLRVTVASDQPVIPISDNSGSLTVDAPVGTPVFVTTTPSTTGGWTPSLKTALTNTNSQVKSGAGTLGGWFIYNPNSSVAYVQIYDTATGSISVGSTTPKLSLGIPALAAANLESVNGINFATAICVAATTTATGGSAPSTALDCNFWYK